MSNKTNHKTLVHYCCVFTFVVLIFFWLLSWTASGTINSLILQFHHHALPTSLDIGQIECCHLDCCLFCFASDRWWCLVDRGWFTHDRDLYGVGLLCYRRARCVAKSEMYLDLISWPQCCSAQNVTFYEWSNYRKQKATLLEICSYL